MKNYEKIVGTAVRIEYSENDGRLFLVFEITDPQSRQNIKTNWTKDLEYKIIDKQLVEVTNE